MDIYTNYIINISVSFSTGFHKLDIMIPSELFSLLSTHLSSINYMIYCILCIEVNFIADQ
jgi:hypothetical protein